MKKWLGEASALCGHCSEKRDDNCKSSNDANPHANSAIEDTTSHNINLTAMGIGVSSESFPVTSNVISDNIEHNVPCACSLQLSIPVHHPMTFTTSVNRPIQVSSPCCNHHATPVSVQLHTAPELSQHSASIPAMLNSESNLTNIRISPCNSNSNEINSSQHLCKKETKPSAQAVHIASNLSDEIIGISYQANSHQPLSHCQAKALPLSSTGQEFQMPSTSLQSSVSEPNSGRELHSENGIDACDQIIYRRNGASGSVYDATLLPSSSKCINSAKNHYGTTLASSSTGCGHWCSACRVKVQVEVECVSTAQRSPTAGRRGIRTLSFPKRVRHKLKAPAKDLNGNKKRKSPWSFKFNCRIGGSTKNESEPEFSPLNIGCGSCVCPRYHCPDSEPVYRSGNESSSSINNSNVPIVDLARFNPESYPINDFDENARQERAREIAEGVDPPPGFNHINNQNGLTMPLSYNSMLDLRMFFENSLRLGIRSRTNGGIPFTGDPFVSTCLPETSAFSRTVHTQVDYIHCLVPDLLAITNCGFYWGKMDRYEAEKLLENRHEGTFLLRDSAQMDYLFSVSFRRYDRSLHARIEQWNHKFSFDSHDPGVFASDTVCGLIKHYKDPSCCMFFEPLLMNPLARSFPFPLQHLCRAAICSNTTYDGINKLELPKSLKNYLKEYHYKQRLRVRNFD